jgi:hypothetical protein
MNGAGPSPKGLRLDSVRPPLSGEKERPLGGRALAERALTKLLLQSGDDRATTGCDHPICGNNEGPAQWAPFRIARKARVGRRIEHVDVL